MTEFMTRFYDAVGGSKSSSRPVSYYSILHTANLDAGAEANANSKGSPSNNNHIHNIPEPSHHLSLLCLGGRVSAGQVVPAPQRLDPREVHIIQLGSTALVSPFTVGAVCYTPGCSGLPVSKGNSRKPRWDGRSHLDKHALGNGMIGR